MACGIYRILCLGNQEFYYGSAVNFARRQQEHLYRLRKQNHKNHHLQNAYNKYGKDCFVFEFIEEVEPEKLFEREQFYLDKMFDRSGNRLGFNIAMKAEGTMSGRKISEKQKRQISEAQKGNKNCVGRVISNKTKLNISLSKGRGYTISLNRKKKYRVHCLGIWESFYTEQEAINKVNKIRSYYVNPA
jgi:group I intron endonuclease